MAGFAILFDPDSTPQARENDFQSLLQRTARFKQLELPATQAVGKHCTAAKLDAPASIHPGIVMDEITGSWLLATGTVVSLVSDNPSDTSLDALLRDYLDHGTEALERYDGHCGLVIYDAQEETLSVISDPMGCFAVYYARRGRQIFVSTSALAVARQVDSKPDTLLIECFLRTGRPHGEKTLWQDVKRVRPATVLKVTRNKIEEVVYWKPTVDESVARLSLDEAVEQATEILERTFRRVLQREGKLWADLTGGFDTRVTTMIMAKVGIPFIAYCVGPDDHPDVQVSRLICQEMGWEYRHMPLPDNWEKEQSSWFETALYKGDGHLNVLQLAAVIRGTQERSLTSSVRINGAGMDEWRFHVFGSKTFFHSPSKKVNYDDILDSRVFSPIPVTAMRWDRTAEARKELLEHLLWIESSCLNSDVLTRTDIMFLRHRHPTHAGAYLSADSGVMRALMPVCFKELENFGLSLNPYWRLSYHFGFVRNLLEQSNPRLASIRTAKGDPAIPIRLTNIHKFGPLWRFLIDHFSDKAARKLFGKSITIWPGNHHIGYPLPSWRARWLNWAVSEGLLEPSLMHSGTLYDPGALSVLVKQGMAGNDPHGEFLDRVITVEMALRAVGASVES